MIKILIEVTKHYWGIPTLKTECKIYYKRQKAEKHNSQIIVKIWMLLNSFNESENAETIT